MIKIKKLTPYNIFIKWPRIILWRYFEKYIRRSFLGGIIFSGKPVILTDDYGMKFVLYPWVHEPLEKLLSRRYLKDEFEAISKLVKENHIVIDVGANIGTHSVYMSKIVGKNGKVFSFEPVADTYYLLKENLALNHVENVEVIKAALKEKDGNEVMNVFPSDFSEWNSFGVPETNESKPTDIIEVRTMKLDTFEKENNIKHIDFLKIDVEGSERYVLSGATELLKNGLIDIFSFEVSQAPLKGLGETTEKLFEYIGSFRYKVYEYDTKSQKFLGPIQNSTEQYKNYYASRTDLQKL
jgi:FkbM family methyltransferase